MKKENVIVVGGFGYDNPKIHAGGVMTSTRILMNSSFAHNLNVLRIDTTGEMGENTVIKVFKSVKRVWLLVYYILRYQPKAMFAWSGGVLSLYEKLLMSIICRLLFVRPVIMYVGSFWMKKIIASPFMSLIHKYLFMIPSRIVCRSSAWVDMYEKIGVSSDRCSVVYNWIDLHEYKLGKAKHDTFNYLYVGWLIKDKGVYELVEAFKSASEENPSARLNIVGSGPEEDNLKDRVKKYNLTAKVNFHGWVKSDDVKPFYKDADALVLPSYGEGFPYVIVEAMASKTPVISTPVGGIPGVLRDNETVFFAEVGNAENLFNKMKYVYCEKEHVKDVVNNAYALATENNDVEKMSAKLISILIGKADT